MARISVTIPVYNVENYLRKCLDSVINQTFKEDYEIICVDDGSTDNSGLILDEYAQKYSNIKVIHQENQGLSEARNTALQYVQGEYTMFVDSDDSLDPSALEKLYKYARKYRSDVVIFDFYRIIDGTGKASIQQWPNIANRYKNETFNAKTAEPFVYRFISVATWNKFYKTSLVKDIKFVKDLNNQDVVHWAEVYTKAKRINYYPVPLYNYVLQREDAITQNKGKKVFDVFKAFSLAEKVLRDSGYFNKFRSIHYAHFTSNLINALHKIKPEFREELIQKIKECPIEIDYNKFETEDFFAFEKDNMRIIKFIKENDSEKIKELLEYRKIW